MSLQITVSPRVDAILSSKVAAERPKQWVSYDPGYLGDEGYWLCPQCKSIFYGGKAPVHRAGCPKKLDPKRVLLVHTDPDLVFVVGEKSKAENAPFHPEEIEKVKQAAQKVRSKL